MRADEVLQALHSLASAGFRQGMQRFAIPVDHALGIATPTLQRLARKIGKSHELAAALWDSGIFEARVIAALIDEPDKVTPAQMDRWARTFDSWAICDSCCSYLFRRTPFAWAKAVEWTKKRPEFVKRAGFALMAYLAIHDKEEGDMPFRKLLAIIERESEDGRLYVRKAVNWALRQIGKRNARLNKKATQTAEAIRKCGTPSARWIAADALRELRSAGIQKRLRLKEVASRQGVKMPKKTPTMN